MAGHWPFEKLTEALVAGISLLSVYFGINMSEPLIWARKSVVICPSSIST